MSTGHRPFDRLTARYRTRAVLLRGGVGLLLVAVLLSGCGYSMRRPFNSGVRTIHVEMFQNRDFRRTLEFRLTEAIVKRLEMDSGYRVTTRQNAQTVLSGELVEVHQNVLGDSYATDLPRETSATFVVSYRWKDQRTGAVLAERQRFGVTATYIRPAGETFFDGAVRGLDSVAEQLVESMESSW